MDYQVGCHSFRSSGSLPDLLALDGSLPLPVASDLKGMVPLPAPLSMSAARASPRVALPSLPTIETPLASGGSPTGSGAQTHHMSMSLSERRDKIITELFKTEDTYVQSLHVMMEHFIRPLKSAFAQVKQVAAEKLEKENSALCVTPEAYEDMSTLFITWETILGCHAQFRDALGMVARSTPETTDVGSIILENVRSLY